MSDSDSFVRAKIVIDTNYYNISAVVDGPNGAATRLAFYPNKEEAGKTAEYAIDFRNQGDLINWMALNNAMVRKIFRVTERRT